MTPIQRAQGLFEHLDAVGASAQAGESFDRSAMLKISEAGLAGLCVPKAAGGHDVPLLEAVEVWAELARADGSIGWCAFAADTALGYFGAYLPDEGLQALLSHSKEMPLPIVAGQFAPNGVANMETDSWILDGNYQFGSGLTIADVAGAGFFGNSADSDDAAYLMGWMPVSAVEMRGNWDVLGLQATQSIDYTVKGAAIPADCAFDFFSPVVYRGSAKHYLGVLPLTAAGHAAWALGVSRRMLDELKHAAGRTRMGASSRLAESDHFLVSFARLESRLRAGWSWVAEVCEQAESECDQRGDWISVATSLLVRQACVHVNREAVAIAQESYSLAGTTALRDGPMQRCFRDLHAGTQHYFASDAASLEWATSMLKE